MNVFFPKKILFVYSSFAFIYLLLIPFIHFPLNTLLKSIPILFLLLSIKDSFIDKHIKYILISALLFSTLGDITLTLPFNKTLALGIGFFILAHLSYISLFIFNFTYQAKFLVYFLLILILVIFLLVWMKSYLGDNKISVLVYLTVLMTMVFTALQTKQAFFMIAIGAVLFLASDLMLAFNLFVVQSVTLDICVMFFYYAAQLLLVLGSLYLYQFSYRFSVNH